MAKLVLLTGLIGSGKSTVAKMLREKGYVVHDTDSMTKKLYDQYCIKAVVSDLFGPRAFKEWPEEVPEFYMRNIDFDFIKDAFFDKGYRNEALKLSTALMSQFYCQYDLHDVKTDKEFIFVEAAQVYYLPSFIMHYDIDAYVIVECNETDRYKRLRERGLTISLKNSIQMNSLNLKEHVIFFLQEDKDLATCA